MNDEMIHNAQEAKISERVHEGYERGMAEERARIIQVVREFGAELLVRMPHQKPSPERVCEVIVFRISEGE